MSKKKWTPKRHIFIRGRSGNSPYPDRQPGPDPVLKLGPLLQHAAEVYQWVRDFVPVQGGENGVETTLSGASYGAYLEARTKVRELTIFLTCEFFYTDTHVTYEWEYDGRTNAAINRLAKCVFDLLPILDRYVIAKSSRLPQISMRLYREIGLSTQLLQDAASTFIADPARQQYGPPPLAMTEESASPPIESLLNDEKQLSPLEATVKQLREEPLSSGKRRSFGQVADELGKKGFRKRDGTYHDYDSAKAAYRRAAGK